MNPDDRRTSTRLPQELSLYVEVGERVHPVEDISNGGVRFYSSVPYPAGARIEVSDDTEAVRIPAEVLECEQVPMESTNTGHAWRVRGRFMPAVADEALRTLLARRSGAGGS